MLVLQSNTENWLALKDSEYSLGSSVLKSFCLFGELIFERESWQLKSSLINQVVHGRDR